MRSEEAFPPLSFVHSGDAYPGIALYRCRIHPADVADDHAHGKSPFPLKVLSRGL
jgi:hypothetical protein